MFDGELSDAAYKEIMRVPDYDLRKPVVIEKYPTSIRFLCTHNKLENGIDIFKFKKQLCEYTLNHKVNKWFVSRQYMILKENRVASIPRFYLKYLVDYIRGCGGIVDIREVFTPKGRDVKFKINDWWVPRENQIEPIAFLANTNNSAKFSMRALPLATGVGKEQPIDSKIKTPTGWVCMGDANIGNEVVTPCGATAVITDVFPQGIKPVYRITFEDGRRAECGLDHLWKVTDGIDWSIVTTKEIIDKLKNNRVLHIPLIVPQHNTETTSKQKALKRLFATLIKQSNKNYHSHYSEDDTIIKIKYETIDDVFGLFVQKLVRSLGGKCTLTKIHTLTTTVDIVYYKKRDISHTLKIDSVDYIGEKECKCIMIDHPDRLYITDNHIATHNSFCAVKATAIIGKVTMIIVGRLLEQWYEIIMTGRNNKPPQLMLSTDDLYVIRGADSLCTLIESTDYYPSIILASIQTLRNYVVADKYPYNELLPFSKMVEKFGIGHKIIDESHEHFATIVDIDLHSNIAINTYLSATFLRGDRQSKAIYEKVFPPIIMYEVGELKKYVDIYYYSYTLGYIKENRVVRFRYGYSQSRYEGVILADNELTTVFMNLLNNCVVMHYFNTRRPLQKCLILANTVSMCDRILLYFKEKYPDEVVLPYYSDSGDENLIDGVSIIVSTVKKGGTGLDTDKLKTTINTTSIGSEVAPIQILGRLRELVNDTPIYIAMYNRTLDAHMRHYRFCAPIYKQRSVNYFEFALN